MKRPLVYLTGLLSAFLLSFTYVTYDADDFVEFTAYLAEGKVNIQWRASQRSKIKEFVLERSRDNKTYTPFKSILDEGKSPETAEFMESDFNPMLGWSYYRIKHETTDGEMLITHPVPIFYKANRLKKGEVIIPKDITDDSPGEETTMSLSEFHQANLVFILRNKGGEEFYVESQLIVDGDTLSVAADEKLPAGEYMITACTKTPLLGLSLTAK